MKRIVIAGASVLLALALLGFGALLPSRGDKDGQGTAGGASLSAASLTVGRGDIDATIASLEARADSDLVNAETFASLGLAYLNKARSSADPAWYTRAEEALETSLDLDADENFTAFIGMGLLAGARHDFPASLEWAERAQEANRFDAFAYGIEGDALIQLGFDRAAEDAFQRMVDRRPDLSSFARISYARQVGGDIAGAIDAMELARDASSTPDDVAWTSYNVAELYVGSGRLERAEKEYRRGAAADPEHYLPDEGFAHLAFTRGEIPKAIELLSSVVKRVPLPDYIVALGELHLLNGDEALAEEQFALAEAASRRFHEAGVTPDTEEVLFYADDRRDPARALLISRSLMKTRFRNAEVVDAHAWALHANKRHAAAEKHIRRALASRKGDPLILFHGAQIAEALGRPEVARRRYERAIAVDPYFSFRYSHVAQQRLRALSRGDR